MRARRALIISSLLLIACSGEPEKRMSDLPSEEVLKRAAEATQTLESAQYTFNITFDIQDEESWSAKGVARLDGMLRNAGEQMRFQVDLTADTDGSEGASSITGTSEFVIMSDNEVYMNLHSLTSQPNNTIFSPEVVGKLAGQWWLLPPGESITAPSTVSPDPRLLHAQAKVVAVTEDHGLVTITGRDAHHYSVALDNEKLFAYLESLAIEKGEKVELSDLQPDIDSIRATGELWIDAETYYIQKIHWDVTAVNLEGGGTATATVKATFRNHNTAPVIQPPENAKLFSPAVFFSLPEDAYFPEEVLPTLPDELNDEDITELIQQLNSF